MLANIFFRCFYTITQNQSKRSEPQITSERLVCLKEGQWLLWETRTFEDHYKLNIPVAMWFQSEADMMSKVFSSSQTFTETLSNISFAHCSHLPVWSKDKLAAVSTCCNVYYLVLLYLFKILKFKIFGHLKTCQIEQNRALYAPFLHVSTWFLLINK